MAKRTPNKALSGIHRTEIGKSGLRWAQYGYITDEFLAQLRGIRGIRVYREMADNDAIVGACLHAITQILREIRWTVKSPLGKDGNKEDMAFLEENMTGMTHSWSDFMSEVMSMFTYGWAWFEQIYRLRDDGKAVWKKLPIRAQSSLERWEMLDNGETIGLWQRAAPSYQLNYIPLRKSILFRTVSKYNNPEGKSIIRNAYRPWYFKKNLEEIEAIGIERDATGIPVMTLPEGMSMDSDDEEDLIAIQWAKDIVSNIRRDEQDGLILPFGWEFALLSSPGQKMFDVSQTIGRYSKEIAISTLSQFIMLGMERTGSYALSKELIDLFHLSLEAYADYIATNFNRQAVGLLFGLNGVHDRPLPFIAHTPIRREALKDMAYFISQLQKAEAIDIDKDIKDYLKRYARLKEYSEERK